MTGRVLIACEFSGVVRRAFAHRGFDAWSCDLFPAEDRSNKHITGDVRSIIHDGWDMLLVAHPPCTRLCNSGVRWLHEPPGKISGSEYTAQEIEAYATMTRGERLAFMWDRLDRGAALFSELWNAPVPRVCIENPVMHPHAKRRIRNYEEWTQTIQPYEFGHPDKKRTCLWLRNLPALRPTRIVPEAERIASIHRMPPGPDRARERSRTFTGIAEAMADQWGPLLAGSYAEKAA